MKKRNPYGHSTRHRVVISVRFDKPCSATRAAAEVRNSIHGDFYCGGVDGEGPQHFKVTGAARITTPRPARPQRRCL